MFGRNKRIVKKLEKFLETLEGDYKNTLNSALANPENKVTTTWLSCRGYMLNQIKGILDSK